MTTKFTEWAIEKFAIELLEKSGYQYVYAPDSDTPVRESFEDVLLLERLRPQFTNSRFIINRTAVVRDPYAPLSGMARRRRVNVGGGES